MLCEKFLNFHQTFPRRYKNGQKVQNTHIKYFEYPIAKIETIDPEDEGLYQCIARNDYGEVSSNFYLHIPPRTMMMHGPRNVKCFPMAKNIMHVTFERDENSNLIQYYIASDSPRDFHSQLSININDRFNIDTSKMNVFKPFNLYMRLMNPVDSQNSPRIHIVSKLSKPIVCASQGIDPKFVNAPNGIFLRWDIQQTDTNITGFTVQFLNNETSSPVVFSSGVVGTFESWPAYVSWNEVQKKLEKIAAENAIEHEWSEVRVPGNVTGLWIPNTEEVNVRILGTILESGELFTQDLQFLNWTNIKVSSLNLEPLRLGEFDSRSAEILWNGLDSVSCAYMCSSLKQDFIGRDSESQSKCEEM